MSLSNLNVPAGSPALAGYLYALTNKHTFNSENDLANNVFTIGFSLMPPSACDDMTCVFAKMVTNGPAAMNAVRERIAVKKGANPVETIFKSVKGLGIHELLTVLHCSSD